MIKAVNTISIKKGFADQIIEKFRELKGIKSAPGFLGLEIWKLENGEELDEVKVCSTWENHDDFKAWTESDAFKARHKHMNKEGVPAEREQKGPVLGAELTVFSVPISHSVEQVV